MSTAVDVAAIKHAHNKFEKYSDERVEALWRAFCVAHGHEWLPVGAKLGHDAALYVFTRWFKTRWVKR